MLIEYEKVPGLFILKIHVFLSSKNLPQKTFVIFDACILMNYNIKFNIKPSQLNSEKVLSINTYLERESASLGKGDRNKV